MSPEQALQTLVEITNRVPLNMADNSILREAIDCLAKQISPTQVDYDAQFAEKDELEPVKKDEK